ncbi:MAG TPA: DNA N-6-adenine-methyltransferase [Vulgatibacter sp.]
MNATVERQRTNNDLCTPAVVLDLVRQLGRIALDPCSNPWSEVGAGMTLDGTMLEEDGLLADWGECVKMGGGGLVFVNPPYGRGELPKWADKIASEARVDDLEIVALVPASTDTRWWDVLRREATAIAYWCGRLKFGGGDHGAGTFGSAAFYFGKRRFLFAHLFDPHADVRVIG